MREPKDTFQDIDPQHRADILRYAEHGKEATNGDAWGSREIAKHVLEVAECSDCVAPANFYDAEAMLRLAAQRLEEQDDEIERLRAMEKRAQDAHLVAYGEESQVIGYILYGERD